jgi:hypothetical protein
LHPEGFSEGRSTGQMGAGAFPRLEPAVSPAFTQALADRQARETWFGGLSGQYKAGAEFWSGQRSLPQPAGCFAAGGRSLGDWSEGCATAQRLLAPADARRKSEPNYRLGWNSFNPSQAAPTPSTVNRPPPAQPVASPSPAPIQFAPQLPSASPAKPATASSNDAAPVVPLVPPAVGNRSCKDDWRQCRDNSDLVNNFDGYYRVEGACKTAANEMARYGTPIWPSFWSDGGAFGRFRNGTDYVTTGVALAIERDAQFQNGFGAMMHSTVYCKYDLKTATVVSVDIVGH